ncbi:Protein phosphatase 2C 6 [Sporothrix epigloea]|uniref:Protein phosphatase 2C 6 n=1 Tax=Sporothrix epigloea TaxID=1892477 RepID=A0ABP0DBL2_9PEZI
MAPTLCQYLPRAAPTSRATSASPRTQRLALLDAFMGFISVFFAHGRPLRAVAAHSTLPANYQHLRQRLRRPGIATSPSKKLSFAITTSRLPTAQPSVLTLTSYRHFHNYFVTHLPSSSLHPDSRGIASHKLPRAASVPHTPGPPGTSITLPVAVPSNSAGSNYGLGRDLTVVRIPLRSAKHHFGASNARGSRPYNEDTTQAGTIDMPAFSKRAPISLVRSAISNSRSTGEGITADGAGGDPQIFYFAVFDGHGGTECADFLRDELHGYIEEAAAEFGLTSSLRQRPIKVATVGKVSGDAAAEQERNSDDTDSEASRRVAGDGEQQQDYHLDNAIRLQRELLQEYRSTVGGYFRRFKPACFVDNVAPPSSQRATPAPPPVTIDSVLTYAFLRADLDFVSAQARKPDPDDPYVSDFPLNHDEVLGAPHHQPPSGHAIGGRLRFKGGSTASVALISTPTPAPFWHPAAQSSLLVAHVGDTRVLLCETATGKARPLTRDHHPSSPVEARRLTRFAESLVTDSFGEERISGLANSRAFGDMQSKRIGVSAEPELERVELGPAQFSFLVLVSDGVSGTLSDQEIVDVVKEARTPEQGSRDVVNYATEVSRDGDNATCLVVRLGGWERRSEGGVGFMGTKELRDARRAEANDPRRGRM